MVSPRHRLVFGCAALLAFAAGVSRGMDSAAGGATPPAGASPRIKGLISAAVPKYEPPKPPEETAAVRSRLVVADQPANQIPRLPAYIVKERRLPNPEEVLSVREQEKYAMEHFLGDERGIDRGFLNLITVPMLWKKIPILGRFPLVGFATNEERALVLYKADLQRRKMENLAGLSALKEDPPAPAPEPAP